MRTLKLARRAHSPSERQSIAVSSCRFLILIAAFAVALLLYDAHCNNSPLMNLHTKVSLRSFALLLQNVCCSSSRLSLGNASYPQLNLRPTRLVFPFVLGPKCRRLLPEPCTPSLSLASVWFVRNRDDHSLRLIRFLGLPKAQLALFSFDLPKLAPNVLSCAAFTQCCSLVMPTAIGLQSEFHV